MIGGVQLLINFGDPDVSLCAECFGVIVGISMEALTKVVLSSSEYASGQRQVVDRLYHEATHFQERLSWKELV